jgi:hypothetical protein
MKQASFNNAIYFMAPESSCVLLSLWQQTLYICSVQCDAKNVA